MEYTHCVLNRPQAEDVTNKTLGDWILSVGTLGNYNLTKYKRATAKQKILAEMEIAKFEGCKQLYWLDYYKKMSWY